MRSEKNKNGATALLDRNKSYRPSDKEPFMNERQRDYFRTKLSIWKDEILAESRETLETLQAESHNHPEYGASQLRFGIGRRCRIQRLDAERNRSWIPWRKERS